jgi:NCS1 family nucleobase:cation symporter-1
VSQPDFSRFARRERNQVWGQAVAFILVGTIMPLFGCLVSSATLEIYGEAIWNPPVLIVTWLSHNYDSATRAAAAFAGIGMTISQLAVLVVDNAYSVGIDLCGLFPTFLNIRRGSYLGLALGMAFCPWELLSSAAVFLSVISGFTVFFGPICGIQICDYWVLRRKRLRLSDLYHLRSEGIYYYVFGVNWRSFVAWVAGWAPLLPGFMQTVQPAIPLRTSIAKLYDLAFVLGFAIAFIVHLGLNLIFPPPGLGEIDDTDMFRTFTDDEAQTLGLHAHSPADSEIIEERVNREELKIA